jgi:hypothetical protein
MRMKHIATLLAVVSLVLLGGCRTGSEPPPQIDTPHPLAQDTLTVVLKVVDQAGNPIPNVEIVVGFPAVVINPITTDVNGMAKVTCAPGGHRISLGIEGFLGKTLNPRELQQEQVNLVKLIPLGY